MMYVTRLTTISLLLIEISAADVMSSFVLRFLEFTVFLGTTLLRGLCYFVYQFKLS
jgi:hypothetical protein